MTIIYIEFHYHITILSPNSRVHKPAKFQTNPVSKILVETIEKLLLNLETAIYLRVNTYTKH